MAIQKGNVREFNRLYGNLIEVCNRVFGDNDYPKEACANWFVNDLQTLLGNAQLKSLLREEQMILILEMATNLRTTTYLASSNKKVLTQLIKEVASLRDNLTQQTL